MATMDKVALVTGGAKRIGAVLVARLHAMGYRVGVHYNSSHTHALALAEGLNHERADSALLLEGDLAADQTPVRLIEQLLARWGRCDALINNASVFHPTKVDGITRQDWDAIMSVNLRAPFMLSQAASPYLRESQGCIINLTDIYGERPLPAHSVYSMSKAGLIMMTRSLALELAPDVRVNGISPGAVLWPEQADAAHTAAILNKTALRRSGSPDDIAQAAAYLLTADYVTGQVLAVDGGRMLHI
ncbi:MAG: pteridine reductase [Gammaproteobacteria bacterium]|nr:pteridine reductase [Gammaproteobacteria bacterium]